LRRTARFHCCGFGSTLAAAMIAALPGRSCLIDGEDVILCAFDLLEHLRRRSNGQRGSRKR
jgi:hypothetical protein